MWPGRHVDRLLTSCYLPVCLFFLLLTMKLSAWTRLRLLSCYLGFAVAVAIVPIVDLAVIGHDLGGGAPEAALSVILAMCALVGMLDGIGQGALYGDAALLPPEYTHAIVGGTASAGTLICVLRVITKAAAPETVSGLRRASNAYFFVTVFVSLLCFAVFEWVVPRIPLVHYWRHKRIHDSMAALPAKAPTAAPTAAAAPSPPASPRHAGSTSPIGRALDTMGSLNTSLRRVSLSAPFQSFAEPLAPAFAAPPTVVAMLRRRWQLIVGMALLYVVTLAIFPGFLAEDVSDAKLGSWYPVILFLVFNMGDLIGKLFPHFNLQPSQWVLLVLSVSRVVFFPAFYCAAHFHAPPAVIALLTLALGLSNGYVTALIFARTSVGLTAIEADMAANMVVIGLVTGLLIGAYTGWMWLLRR